ncbi:hypothetical protein MAR621_03151 [Maribacter dokdonensis]|uniref:hypothetical protein n=1 Tax=Maribacter dokdonensis TaxID=320912 RepID=UPI001B232F0F|nr:hypothetical protein [Maribacter dokdonensis]CAG2532957.1 hypothetical protein MAR621_03151 [Maribacter dokdonensis]
MTTTSNEQPTTKNFDYKKFNEYKKTPLYWGRFNSSNSKHMYILSLLRQMEWTVINEHSGRSYADLERLGKWLQSDKAPVQKPLMKMDTPKQADPSELSRTISALENMVSKFHKGK